MTQPSIGKRHTRQRTEIQRLIEAADGPLTIEEIHDRARPTLPRIGVATVYRTVKLLLASAQIQGLVLPDGVTRYERAAIGHHHHFSCRRCEKTFDIDVCPLSIPRGTTFPGGYIVEDHELTLYGTCPSCAKPIELRGRARP